MRRKMVGWPIRIGSEKEREWEIKSVQTNKKKMEGETTSMRVSSSCSWRVSLRLGKRERGREKKRAKLGDERSGGIGEGVNLVIHLLST
jgi:hypothetical protein